MLNSIEIPNWQHPSNKKPLIGYINSKKDMAAEPLKKRKKKKVYMVTPVGKRGFAVERKA